MAYRTVGMKHLRTNFVWVYVQTRFNLQPAYRTMSKRFLKPPKRVQIDLTCADGAVFKTIPRVGALSTNEVSVERARCL